MEVIVAERTADLVRLEISGRMDTAGVEKTEARFYASFAPIGVSTLLDLTKVVILASMGLRLIITGAKTARAKGFRLVLVAPRGPIRDVLDGAAIGELLPIADDVESAKMLLHR